MSRLVKRDGAYTAWVAELKSRYQSAQIKASIAVNSQMLAFYWELGRDIVDMQAENRYGSGFYAALSHDLMRALPDTKGFSPRNLRYMKSFYELFPRETMLPQPVADSSAYGERNVPQPVANSGEALSLEKKDCFLVPWGHMRLLIDKCKGDRDKALFYVRKTVENNWSRAVLANFLDTGFYERQA